MTKAPTRFQLDQAALESEGRLSKAKGLVILEQYTYRKATLYRVNVRNKCFLARLRALNQCKSYLIFGD